MGEQNYNSRLTEAPVSDETKNLINYNAGYSSRRNEQNTMTIDPNHKLSIKDEISDGESTPRLPG